MRKYRKCKVLLGESWGWVYFLIRFYYMLTSFGKSRLPQLEFIEDIISDIGYYYRKARNILIREPKYFIQRGIRGYSDRDLWNFWDYLQEIAWDGLWVLAERFSSHPMKYTESQWKQLLLDNSAKLKLGLYKRWGCDEDIDIYLDWERLSREGIEFIASHVGNLWD